MFGLKSLNFLNLQRNNLSGTFTVAADSPYVSRIILMSNSIARIEGAGVLTGLSLFDLERNEFAGDLKVTEDNFPASLEVLSLRGNRLTGFADGAVVFPNLQNLFLKDNELQGDLDFEAEKFQNFPTSIISLDLYGNKLTGFVNGKILTNLVTLMLANNEFTGDFTITEEDFPTSIVTLSLRNNKLTSFTDGKYLTNLENLGLSNNDLKGDLIITAENFSNSIKSLHLEGNIGLTSVDADSDAVPNLEGLVISCEFIVKEELRSRPEVKIYHGTACE